MKFKKPVRSSDPPQILAELYRCKFRDNCCLKFENGITMKWNHPNWSSIYGEPVWYRESFVALYINESIIGGAIFTEIKVVTEKGYNSIWVDQLIKSCDSESEELWKAANAIGEALKKFGISNRDSVLSGDKFIDFTILWLQPQYSHARLWVKPINEFIRMKYINKAILMVARPFPLEFSHILDHISQTDRRKFDNRVRAMQRHYYRTIGLQTLNLESIDTENIYMAKKLSSEKRIYQSRKRTAAKC